MLQKRLSINLIIASHKMCLEQLLVKTTNANLLRILFGDMKVGDGWRNYFQVFWDPQWFKLVATIIRAETWQIKHQNRRKDLSFNINERHLQIKSNQIILKFFSERDGLLVKTCVWILLSWFISFQTFI